MTNIVQTLLNSLPKRDVAPKTPIYMDYYPLLEKYNIYMSLLNEKVCSSRLSEFSSNIINSCVDAVHIPTSLPPKTYDDLISRQYQNLFSDLPLLPMDYHGLSDYQKILLLILKGFKNNSIYYYDLITIKKIAQYSYNPLFQYALAKYTTGDYRKIISFLMDDDVFPDFRLPTTSNKKTDWLWSEKNVIKGEPGTIHSGTDFLFLASLIIRDLK